MWISTCLSQEKFSGFYANDVKMMSFFLKVVICKKTALIQRENGLQSQQH